MGEGGGCTGGGDVGGQRVGPFWELSGTRWEKKGAEEMGKETSNANSFGTKEKEIRHMRRTISAWKGQLACCHWYACGQHKREPLYPGTVGSDRDRQIDSKIQIIIKACGLGPVQRNMLHLELRFRFDSFEVTGKNPFLPIHHVMLELLSKNAIERDAIESSDDARPSNSSPKSRRG